MELLEQRGERTGVIFHGCSEQSSPAWFFWFKCFPAALRAHPRHTKAMHMQGPVVSCSSRRCRGAGDGRSGGDAPAPLPGQGMAEAGSESASPSPGTASALLRDPPGDGRGDWGSFGMERHPWVWGLGFRATIVQRESGGGRRPLGLHCSVLLQPWARFLLGSSPSTHTGDPLPHPRVAPWGQGVLVLRMDPGTTFMGEALEGSKEPWAPSAPSPDSPKKAGNGGPSPEAQQGVKQNLARILFLFRP